LFPDDDSAEEWLSHVRWPDGVRCCDCDSDRVSVSLHQQMRWRCRQRQGFFSIKKGAVMQSSKISVRKWIAVIYLIAANIPSVSTMKLARVLGITQKSTWHMTHRVRKALEQSKPEFLGGIVEVDETYVGDKKRNQHDGEAVAESIFATSKQEQDKFLTDNIRPKQLCSLMSTDPAQACQNSLSMQRCLRVKANMSAVWFTPTAPSSFGFCPNEATMVLTPLETQVHLQKRQQIHRQEKPQAKSIFQQMQHIDRELANKFISRKA